MDENFVLKEGSLTSGMTDQHQIVNIIDKDVQIEDIGSFVMGDMNSSIITFKMNRYYDGTDLSNKNINVFYRTSNGIYKSETYDAYVSNDSLKFSWIIPYDLTLVKKSKAYVCISSDNYIWKTKMFDISVDASFDISITPPSTNWFITIESGLDSIRKELSGIYEWARKPEKPTYTYEEVGADKAGSSDNAYNKSKEYVDNISKNIKEDYIPNKINEVNESIKENSKNISDLQKNKAGSHHLHSVSDISDFPKSMPASDVPDWAKADKKPEYTANEVGALPNTTPIPSSLSDLSEDENHRTVSDGEKAEWSNKSDFSGSYNDLSDKPDNELTNELKEKYDNASVTANQNKEELKAKLDKSTHTPNKWLNTDSEGNISFSDKPSYNPNEVGAAPAKHNHDDLYASKNSEHTHENKSILDGITSELIEKWSKHLTVRVEDETLLIE